MACLEFDPRPQFAILDSSSQVYLFVSFYLASFLFFVSPPLYHLAAGVFPKEGSCQQGRKQTFRKQKCH